LKSKTVQETAKTMKFQTKCTGMYTDTDDQLLTLFLFLLFYYNHIMHYTCFFIHTCF